MYVSAHLHYVCVCLCVHLCASCQMVFNLSEGLSRYSDQRAAPQLLTLLCVLCNHKLLTLKRGEGCGTALVGHREVFFTLYFLY